ncbi:4-hydroxybenzoate 3-monooxygenase [Amorphoplanes digitatis]|uniref:p-hydroxybenzoate 3-monooxygenase n=1 Tax=Actinoplanes digitatis TaxID=1868 RepID=A0A7W7MQP2_9ACTN|nr:4-hydroxybenzoate 3-monooxygenase [Actinoplanes digitatis]MBB4762770.1 p-hydroxybenzoate 3-monooxygenase [Actinoplanes digitatis]GID91734.1 4-hydroxybenzoate 3-monooxygenase [Actinoplanes digitatis]
MRTQVGIVGAGPAGLVLARLLEREGIDSVVLERRSRSYVEGRVRAGVLEHGTADLLDELGVGARMRREGMVHRGIELRFDGVGHRIDLEGLTGRTITVYGQQEVVKDLIAARIPTGPLHFEAEVTGVDGTVVAYKHDGVERRLECDFVAGCDGSHGVARAAAPPGALTAAERVHPYAWLGILARAPAAAQELVYAYHERGFALHSMRTPGIVRLYLQVEPGTDLADWPDARIWDELRTRLGLPLEEGEVLERGVTPMRSIVVEPMRAGRLFLAGDAAHIVPPTGAKGLNLAVADVRVLAEALTAYYRDGSQELLDAYSATCLKRVWQVQRFSNWMTTMLHRHAGDDRFGHRVQLAELAYVTGSTAAATTLAENYVGLPR